MSSEKTSLDRKLEAYYATSYAFAKAMGTCTRRNVASVLVVNDEVRAVAWNGKGRAIDSPTCEQGGCPRGQLTYAQKPPGSGYSDCIYLHAEYIALWEYRTMADIREGRGWARGVAIYSNSKPCEDCVAHAVWCGASLHWREEGH